MLVLSTYLLDRVLDWVRARLFPPVIAADRPLFLVLLRLTLIEPISALRRLASLKASLNL